MPTTVTILPSNVTLFRGNLVDGDLSDLIASDDSKYQASPGFTLNSNEPPVWLELTGNSPSQDPTQISVVVESNSSTPNIEQTIIAFNYDTGLYEDVDATPISFDETTVEVALTGDLSRFVDSSGEMKLRVGYKATGFVLQFPWVVSVDQVGWVVDGSNAPGGGGGGDVAEGNASQSSFGNAFRLNSATNIGSNSRLAPSIESQRNQPRGTAASLNLTGHVANPLSDSQLDQAYSELDFGEDTELNELVEFVAKKRFSPFSI